MEFLERCREIGVVNIEMEATIFSALTHHAGIKAGIVCVALLNRLHGDQVNARYMQQLFFYKLISFR